MSNRIFILLFFGLALKANASALRYEIAEFTDLESIEAVELDGSAEQKVNKVLPRLYKRFCHLLVRPDSVAVIIGMVQVEWSIDRICQDLVAKKEDKT